MRHLYKSTSLSILANANKVLLIVLSVLSILCLLLGIKAFSKKETFILIPAINTEKQLKISNKTFYQSYLSEWCKSIMHELLTVSYREIDSQMNNLRSISDLRSDSLTKFLKEQTNFVKSNRVSSVFFMKDFIPLNNTQIKINGTVHYWFGDSPDKVAQERVFLITYKVIRGSLIILSNVKDITNESV